MTFGYLAAPYSDSNPEVVTKRIDFFCKVDAKLMALGIFTVSPLLKHFILSHGNLPSDWNYWKSYSEQLLKKCDIMFVIMLPGWDTSVGVLGEIEFCKANGIEITYLDPKDFYDR